LWITGQKVNLWRFCGRRKLVINDEKRFRVMDMAQDMELGLQTEYFVQEIIGKFGKFRKTVHSFSSIKVQLSCFR
jgi:hypothetical protein